MAITWYSSAGQPSDSVGVAGDLNFDTTNRIIWLKQANNSWANGGYSNIGPTGPAMLAGTGAPASGFGQIGNGYTDTASGLTYLKSSSGWSQTGSIIGPQGATGAQGYSSLTSQAAAVGAQCPCSLSLTSTAASIPLQGSTIPLSFTPTQSSALMGLSIANNGSTFTIALVDTTASPNTTVYSASVAAGNFAPTFTATQYPLTANHVYVWQASASSASTANFAISPIYLMPAAASQNVISPITGFLSASGTAFSSTAVYPYFGANKTSGTCRAYYPVKTVAISYIVAQYVPSAAGAATATVTGQYQYYNNSGGTTTTLGSFTVTNTGLPQITTLSSPISFNTGGSLYMNYTGSGTGQVNADFYIIQ